MGLLKIILGFDRGDLERLRREIEQLRESLETLTRAMAEIKLEQERLQVAYTRLLGEMEVLREENRALKAALEGYGRELKEVEKSLGSIANVVTGLEARIAQADDRFEAVDNTSEEHLSDDAVETVLEKILEGVTSPTEIIESTGLSKHKVYEALKRLVSEGLVEKRREGRRVHYYPTQLALKQEGVQQAGTAAT